MSHSIIPVYISDGVVAHAGYEENGHVMGKVLCGTPATRRSMTRAQYIMDGGLTYVDVNCKRCLKHIDQWK